MTQPETERKRVEELVTKVLSDAFDAAGDGARAGAWPIDYTTEGERILVRAFTDCLLAYGAQRAETARAAAKPDPISDSEWVATETRRIVGERCFCGSAYPSANWNGYTHTSGGCYRTPEAAK
jgi:hypothetical protein